MIRSVADVPRIFICNARKALALRGAVGQVATAEKVIEEMNQAR